ncbi:hypothetical protein EUGRSUZ_K01280 [Eucalyptus grandis]|uniref:Uncharacterized protein n=2 Tax=Eucalyptus grandis TaxID=71139 RepID=A0ACC3ITB7_EUCGR|nr:hypothetical protein EUGRSUZ_K01280 [Eucalyptus grandis]
MGSRALNFFTRFRRPLPVDAILGTHSLDEVRQATVSLGKVAAPIAATTLLIFSRSIISMLFLSRLGKTDLAGGSLALAFANITGYSILKGLAMGMEPICSQAFGAKKPSILIQTYQKTLLCLLLICIPISLLWLNMEPLFLRLGQDEGVVKVARACMVCFIPELFAQALLQPLRTFLRTQGLTTPVTVACLIAGIVHLPINYLLVVYIDLRATGVALALAWNSINTTLGLLAYLVISKKTIKPWQGKGVFLRNFPVYGVLAGTARPDLGARIKLFSFYFIGMPIAILLAFKWEFGFRGLWFGLLASQISCVSMMAYTLMNMDWKQQAKRAGELAEAAGDKDD